MQRPAEPMKFGGQETIGRGRADGHRTPVRIDRDLRVDVAQVDQVAGEVGNAVEGVTSADRVDLVEAETMRRTSSTEAGRWTLGLRKCSCRTSSAQSAFFASPGLMLAAPLPTGSLKPRRLLLLDLPG